MSRRVVVWRWTLLPGAETFIRNQVRSYTRWTPTLMGADRARSHVATAADVVVFEPRGVRARVARAVFRVTDRSATVRAAVRAARPALIHAHFATDGMRMTRVARAVGVPLVVTVHGSDITRNPRKPGPRGVRYRRRLRRMFARAELIVAVSRHIAAEAERWGADPDRLVVLPMGVAWRERPRPGTRSGFLFIGRLVEKKGLGHLIDALAMLPPELREAARVTVVGEGPLRGAWEERAKQAGVALDFVGFRDAEAVQSMLVRCTALVVPSVTARDGDTEGLPTVVFEAARAGTPVVGFRHAGIPEAVADGVTGLLAPEGDAAGLAEALASLVRSPVDAQRMGAAARERYEREFDSARLTARLEQCYDEVVERFARGSRASMPVSGRRPTP